MTLNLVKGEFSSLEEALRAQVQKLQEHNEKLQIQYKALETKHKNLRACVSGMTQQLRELEGPWDEELGSNTSWPQVPSFGIYMQLVQALMGARPLELEEEIEIATTALEKARESRKKKFKVLD